MCTPWRLYDQVDSRTLAYICALQGNSRGISGNCGQRDSLRFHLQAADLLVERVPIVIGSVLFPTARPLNGSGSCSSAAFRHLAICIGCTSNCDPNWLSVFSPDRLDRHPRLDFGLHCFRVVVIASPALTTPPEF
jgi:hypothetical protein